MVLALLLCGAVVLLVLAGLFAFGVRRRLIQRSGGTFDCNLRWEVSQQEAEEPSGKGWAYGIARYNGDRIEWFRVFSYAPRPRRHLVRGAIDVLERRSPLGEEEQALLSDAIVLACAVGPEHTRVELALSEDALTGFLAWLEAAPPGQRVNVA
ncbi:MULTISPECIES: DUF2550 domain-containing protein [unclassified Streptomyces]|uniref:DUF2550 domain-containing protein n=1 Tax=unclassified Streptomyces TaxID=2593676 RepID=UPI002DD9927D|nr:MULTISPECIES: DUF2550 domain-containing protein [unclassified Streptomyces]WSA92320.1 DUF2550 domain-containing protein [Streptomyces sp. NBC_01795]WSB76689.1 DUF2550 domain-containing protein [Streptomyces sp. NBC_01775]WSS15024.1 DUF2550 domain-containing protein [Streptomyces sp. NBC_01186]WSS43868.1 DUF2550 domain-containing protein [Streptomyces sp. NBC_01187]